MRRAWLVSLVALTLASCATRGPATGVVTIGVVLPQSGEFAALGRSLRDGVHLALDEATTNGTWTVGGRTVRVDVRVEDDRGDPVAGEAAVRRLAEQHVAVLIAGVQSEVASSAARAAEALGAPLIIPSATDPAVTSGRTMVFRVCFDDRTAGRAMAAYAFRVIGARRAALVYDRATAYNATLAAAFGQEFRSLGGRIVAEETFADERAASDFHASLLAIRRGRPDVLFAPNIYRATATLAVQARAAGLTIPVLSGEGANSPDFPTLGGEAVEGAAFPVHYAPDDPAPRAAAFRRRFRVAYGRDPDALGALGYDALRLALDALRRAGSTDPQAVRSALAMTRDFSGVTGTLSFRGTDVDKDVAVVYVRGGAVVFHARVRP